MRRKLLMASVALVVAACTAALLFVPRPPVAASEPPWFADVTDECGIDFKHDAGPLKNYFMPRIVGSGVAAFDFDNDGLLDLYFVQNGGPDSKSTNRLYRQTTDGRFVDVGEGSGLDIAGYGMGVAIADFNNDGWPDVLVTEYGRVRLLLNNRDGKSFTDVTKQAGLANAAWGLSAAFFDYDRDGWLDIIIANYVDYDPSWPCTTASGIAEYCTPHPFPGRVAKLFRNLGSDANGQVRFEDATVAAGLAARPSSGLGVVCADFDGDCWPDIFIANDGKPNHLWINRRDGTFREEAAARGVAFNGMGGTDAGMGIALGDADGDGLLDLFVTHLTEETNTLWKQGPRGLFRDTTMPCNAATTRWRGTGFGVVFGDFDHDGANDLAVVNGRVARAARPTRETLDPHWSWYGERNQLLANDGSGRFRDISPNNPALCGAPNVARSLAWGDLDGDGAIDLVVTTIGDRARIFRNVAPKRGSWLLIRAMDPAWKRDAYGAEVRVHAGRRQWLRLVQPAGSFLASSDARVHFGLGDTARYDRIDVLWPEGTQESFPEGAANRSITLKKGEGVRRGTPQTLPKS